MQNEICQIIYSLHQAKKPPKKQQKVYNNITNSIKFYNIMDTLFMNSENSKRSDLHRLLLNLSDETKEI